MKVAAAHVGETELQRIALPPYPISLPRQQDPRPTHPQPCLTAGSVRNILSYPNQQGLAKLKSGVRHHLVHIAMSFLSR